jgi:ketosteroid isomerase-like protein
MSHEDLVLRKEAGRAIVVGQSAPMLGLVFEIVCGGRGMTSRQRLNRWRAAIFAFLIVVVLVAAKAPQVKAEHNADEDAIRKLNAEWSKTAGTLDVDKTVAYYSDDATVLPPNEKVATSKAAIRALWAGLLAPGTSISWEVTKLEVSKSGDLAYLTGTYKLSMRGPDGKPIDDVGKMVEVWKKQPNKQWKVVADIFNSDLPMK